MAKPTEIPEWATDPGAAVITPSLAKRALGWIVELPPHEFFNWIANRTGQWLRYIDEAFVDVSSSVYATETGLDLGQPDARLVCEIPVGDLRSMRYVATNTAGPVITRLRASVLSADTSIGSPSAESDVCSTDEMWFDRARGGVFTSYSDETTYKRVTFAGGPVPSQLRAGSFSVQDLTVATTAASPLTTRVRANTVKATGVVRPALGTVDSGLGAHNIASVASSGNRVEVTFSVAFDTIPRVSWAAYDNSLGSVDAILCVSDAQVPATTGAACYLFSVNTSTGALAPYTPTGNAAVTLIAT